MKKIHLALIILFIASSLLFIFNIYHVKPIYINKLPYIISSPGYYVINTTTATTLNETAIIINSDNVILDGKGCILKGRGNYCGIKIDDGINIKIKNLVVNNWKYGVFVNGYQITLENISSYENKYGIYALNHQGSIISDNWIYEAGIKMRDCKMFNNSYNFALKNCNLNWDENSNNIDISNTVNRKPIYYCVNKKNVVINESLNVGALYLINCKNVKIEGLNLTNNIYGIFIWGGKNISIKNSVVCFNQWGIYAYKVDNLNLENVSSYSNIVGMHFEFSNKHVKNCRMFNNIFNLVIVDSISQEFGYIENTTVNNKLVYYLINKSDIIIDKSSNAGTVYLINCNNITAKNLNLTNNGFGICLSNTSNSKFENLSISNNWWGLYLGLSYNNTFKNISLISNIHNISGSKGNTFINVVNILISNESYILKKYYELWE
jgi:parallel beta-helix repeat protein